MQEIQWQINTLPKTNDENLALMSYDQVRQAINFHMSFPQYEVTPLVALKAMAQHLGLNSIHVKDESWRFNLNAFKVLGGSFAMGKYIAKETGRDILDTDYHYLTSDALKEDFGQVTFFTATDGNHGRGIAWAANILGQKAVVRMPFGTTETRLQNIAKEGATVTIEELNYDQCVDMANRESLEAERGVMVQDTAWDGYEEIPTWIMQGYGTMSYEADQQLHASGVLRPTHVFVQAGVGSLAGAVVGYYRCAYADNPPKFVVVEPHAANCLYQSALAGDGERRFVGGEMRTIMAGLACGEPNTISWDILKNHVDVFLSLDDSVAERGMRMLGCPLKGDTQVISGESGAAPFGALATIMQDPTYQELKELLGLDENSRVLLFSTEGDTDPVRYKNILWEGKHE